MVNVDLIAALKDRARILHRDARAGDPAALARLRVVPELKAAMPEPSVLQRRHALAAVAASLGFTSWKHATDVLDGSEREDAGKLLYPDDFGGALWNVWFSSHAEAAATRDQTNGYLLPYRRQFFVCEPAFIEQLGLDPEDPDWDRIGRDWARPKERAAWSRLAAKLIAARAS
jgi:hypothetical protein